MKYILLIPTLALAACSNTVYRDHPVEVAVPVHVPCATARPAPVPSLQARVPDEQWNKLDVRQKAAWVGVQLADRTAYGEDLAAATGACPEAEG